MADNDNSLDETPQVPAPIADKVVKTVTIRFTVDTPVGVDSVVRGHCGRIQLRPYAGADKKQHGRMEYYYPAGTTVVLDDYVGSGFAEIVQP